MSNVGRVITISLTISDPEEAKKIWDAHMCKQLISGCRVGGIAEGDLIKESYLWDEYQEHLIEKHGDAPSFEEWKENLHEAASGHL